VKSDLKNVFRKFLATKGRVAIKTEQLDNLYFSASVRDAVARWTRPVVPPELSQFILSQLLTTKSSSQLQQDLLALFISQLSENDERYFVEFGACDGITYSNSCILERQYAWLGLLAEPARQYHELLKTNRKCIIETRCIWEKSNEKIQFSENSEGEYSSIEGFKSNSYEEKKKSTYQVETISLNDLLLVYGAPYKINFLSVDTEGSEWEIIKDFNFDQYRFDFISIEHNYSDKRDRIHTLLSSNGYSRILQEVSGFDDWYVDIPILAKLNAKFSPWKID
jgi:FkbM family methyltransferase